VTIGGADGQHDGRISVLVADDNVVVRRGLISLLEGSECVVVTGEAADRDEAQELAGRHRPDVVISDYRMPGHEGSHGLAGLVTLSRVLVISYNQEPAAVDRALRTGATGYLVYGDFTPAEFIDAVVATARGRPQLSPVALSALVDSLRSPRQHRLLATSGPVANRLSRREAEIIEHMVRGRGNNNIARALNVSEKTVRNHVNHIFAKLGARNRAEAIAVWLGLATSADTDA
jgi:DNA-binding NarL/FixJ family response regulator